MFLWCAPAAAAEREVRDAIGTFENVATSEHFAVKWGDEAPDSADLDGLLEGLESAWDVEVDELGWPGPTGWETSYVNVYLGDSGGDAPAISFPGGFANVDDDGIPYVVVAPEIVSMFSGDDPYGVGATDPNGYAVDLVAHEFFHTLQLTTGSYRSAIAPYVLIGDEADWAWESGADWAAQLVSPPPASSMLDSIAYFVLPYLSLSAVADATADAPYGGMKVYGEWAWWGYLDEVVGDRSIIHDLWSSGGHGDPAADCMGLLAERGYDASALFLDFAAHNTVWDYSWGAYAEDTWQDRVNDYLGQRILRGWDTSGTDGWQEPDPAYALHRLAYHAIEVWAPGAGTWHVAVETDDPGIVATVVVRTSGEPRYVALDEGAGDVTTEADDVALYLVVADASAGGDDDEVHDYRYEIEPVVESGAAPADAGCGCASRPGSPALAGLCVLLPALWRRRR